MIVLGRFRRGTPCFCSLITKVGHKKRTASAVPKPSSRTMQDHTSSARLPTSRMFDSLPAGAPGKKTPDHHRGPTTRVLLVFRQAECTTACQRRLAAENDPWRFRHIVKGHFHSVLVSNIFGYLAFCRIRPGVSQWQNAKLVSFRRIITGLGWLLLSWEPCVYLYIGITSLYLYDSIWIPLLQDGIFHKSAAKLVCKTQIPRFSAISR